MVRTQYCIPSNLAKRLFVNFLKIYNWVYVTSLHKIDSLIYYMLRFFVIHVNSFSELANRYFLWRLPVLIWEIYIGRVGGKMPRSFLSFDPPFHSTRYVTNNSIMVVPFLYMLYIDIFYFVLQSKNNIWLWFQFTSCSALHIGSLATI